MKKKILIMGLPGSGKTTLASKLVPLIEAKWINADNVRKSANDWDFSSEGRKRKLVDNRDQLKDDSDVNKSSINELELIDHEMDKVNKEIA